MFGRENVSSKFVAVLELVKNAYDADASQVIVQFGRDDDGNQTLTILDNGSGMDWNSINSSWLRVGTDFKEVGNRSPGKRVYVGSKGIGRLAMDRLGKHVRMETKRKDGRPLQIDIDWERYNDHAVDFSAVKHPIMYAHEWRYPFESGTVLSITGLREQFGPDDVGALSNDLSILQAPDSSGKGFAIRLEAPEFPIYSGEVGDSLVTLADINLLSVLDETGKLSHGFKHKDGTLRALSQDWKSVIDDSTTKPACGPLEIHLSFFLRDPADIAELDFSKDDLRRLLEVRSGVRIYRDGFRVKPYGEPGGLGDWLNLNARKVKSPAGVARIGQWRVSEYQLWGTVVITKEGNPLLADQTNREGLVQNLAYRHLRATVLSAVRALENERQRHERDDKPAKPKKKPVTTQDAQETATKAREAATVARQQGRAADAAVLDESASRVVDLSRENQELQSANQVLMGLATLGIALATFGHETQDSVSIMAGQAKLIQARIAGVPGLQLEENLNKLRRHSTIIHNWGQFALDHVRKDKRTRKLLDPNQTIRETMAYFAGTLDKLSIDVTYDFKATAQFRMFRMDLEAILINLTTNAIQALKGAPAPRRIHIATSSPGRGQLLVRYEDNGPGIAPLVKDILFNAFVTTKVNAKGEEAGTGLGLTIVRAIAQEYGGSAVVDGLHAPGAAFVVELKARED